MKVDISFQLSDAARKAALIATGDQPAQSQKVEFDLVDATPAERGVIAEYLSGTRIIGMRVIELRDASDRWLNLDAAPTWPEVIAHVQRMTAERDARTTKRLTEILAREIRDIQERLTKHIPEPSSGSFSHIENDELPNARRLGVDLTELMALRAAHAAQIPAFEAERRAQKEAEAARGKANQERIEAERAAAVEAKRVWIAVNGSDHLKRAFAAGYDCQRLYVTERANLEAPRFTVDFDDTAEWRDRSCPSPAALIIEEEFDETDIEGTARVVWLTSPAQAKAQAERWECDEFQECEAVVITRYLGKYTLVVMM